MLGDLKIVLPGGRFRSWPSGDECAILERFQSLCALFGSVKSGIYFHPTGDKLFVGTPVKENAARHQRFLDIATLEPL